MTGINESLMNHEEERLHTFAQWPVNSPVDSSRLAKAGFYYSGSDDEVICFSCKGHIRNWSYGDVVLKKHAELFPNCDFICNRSNNVPFAKYKSDKDSCSLNNYAGKTTVNDLIKHFDKMKIESERLKTFAKSWPLPFMDSQEMVKAGFFYTGIGDKVQCPFCKGMISKWEKGDVPLKEHSKHFPWCDYILENLIKSKNSSSSFAPQSEEVCDSSNCSSDLSSSESPAENLDSDSKPETECNRLIDKSQQHKSLEQLGVNLHKGPIHPEHSTLSARLKSFSSWPSGAPVKKEDLAAAGFFYLGTADQTRCFHCNGGLCRWEKDDDPWIEHARWFCNCDFLQLSKGRDFIESCLSETSNMLCILRENISQNNQDFNLEPLTKLVDETMNSELVKHILKSELYPSCIIRAAVALQIKEKGVSFTDMNSLCLAAAALKEEMDRDDSKMEQRSGLEVCNDVSNHCFLKDDSDLKTVPPNKAEPLNCFQVKSNTCEVGLKNLNNNEDSSKDHYLCKICMDREVGLVFLPCGHLLSCTVCAPALTYCPMCRKAIQATVRAYLN